MILCIESIMKKAALIDELKQLKADKKLLLIMLDESEKENERLNKVLKNVYGIDKRKGEQDDK